MPLTFSISVKKVSRIITEQEKRYNISKIYYMFKHVTNLRL